MDSTDNRRHAPATLRNRDAILQVLHTILPAKGLVLEVASGTGEHIVHFAGALTALAWQPSDPDPTARMSIAAWASSEDAGTILPPLELDACSDWPIDAADAVICINMLHIAPWPATLGLFEGARRILSPGSPLFLYGPFRREGRPLEPGNEAFDQSLRARDPQWGLRELGAVTQCASARGFALERVVEMPANNLSVVFRRTGPPDPTAQTGGPAAPPPQL